MPSLPLLFLFFFPSSSSLLEPCHLVHTLLPPSCTPFLFLPLLALLCGKFLWCHCSRQSQGLDLFFRSSGRTCSKVGQLNKGDYMYLKYPLFSTSTPCWKVLNFNCGLGYKAHIVCAASRCRLLSAAQCFDTHCFPVLLFSRMTLFWLFALSGNSSAPCPLCLTNSYSFFHTSSNATSSVKLSLVTP